MPWEKPAENVGTPYGPVVSFRTDHVLPPTAIYLGPDDSVVLNTRAPSVTGSFNFVIRTLSIGGEVKEQQINLNIGTSGILTQENVLLTGECYLLTAHLQAGVFSRGQCFARGFIRRGVAGAGQLIGQLLFQDYVSIDDHIGFPQSPTRSCLNGRGWTHTVHLTDPGNNTNAVFTVPSGVRWLLKGALWQYTTDATVGNRSMTYFIVDPSGNGVTQIQDPNFITANNVPIFSAAPGFPYGGTALVRSLPFPNDIILASGSTLTIAPTNVGATDHLSNISAQVEEWVTT